MIPKMPALGLLLEYPIFETYNSRVAKANEGVSPADERYRPQIDFEIHRHAIDEFKQKYIYENMRAVEDRDGMLVLSKA
jgi:tRNA pseudouridine38-40 synthase